MQQKSATYDYMVLPGDTLEVIAVRFGSHPAWIIDSNKLKEAQVATGTRLKIPVAIAPGRTAWARGRQAHLITGKPGGDQVKPTTGILTVSAVDLTDQDSTGSPDAVQVLHSTFRDPRDNAVYTVAFRQLLPIGKDHPHLGGVGILKWIFGETGIGTREWPKTLAYLTVWGTSDVYKNAQPLEKGAYTHLWVGQALRDQKGTPTAAPNPADLEAHLVLAGPGGRNDPLKGTPEPFIHLFCRDVDLGVGE